MAWSGRFEFGGAFAVYSGPADDNDLHQHAAYQIVLSRGSEVAVKDELGGEHRGDVLLVRPLVAHALDYADMLAIVYLDPQCDLALELADRIDSAEISVLAPDALPFDVSATPDVLLEALQRLAGSASGRLDARLQQTLAELGEHPGAVSIADAAARCGMSESRLRALARDQLGVPLSTWMIWRKLERAARELANGANLADAALAGGFADQAHFTRAMRRMFGVTPTAAAHSLR